MARKERTGLGFGLLVSAAVLLGAGCQTPPAESASGGPTVQLARYEDRMAGFDLDFPQGPEPGAATQPATGTFGELVEYDPLVREGLNTQIPDPLVRREEVAGKLAAETNETQRGFLEAYLKRLDAVRRPAQVRLTLRDVIERTLAHNYGILSSSYGPAIDAARVVQAEANFDAIYFFNFSNNEQDRPSASQLASTTATTRTFGSGVRKLLVTGTQAEVAYNWTRTETNLIFQTLNPAYTNNLVVSLRQPFLRGFGVDFNRSAINTRQNDRRISFQRFRRQVRDTLQQAEEAYWLLVQGRRALTVSADLLYETEKILNVYQARARVGYDVYKAQLGQIESRYATRQADFVRIKNNVKDAEDRLKGILHDHTICLADDIELIPTDVPTVEPLVMNRLGEIQTAMENRSELKEARLQVENSRIAIDVAKNSALPRLDVTFRYMVDGLGESTDDAFDQLTMNDFNEYFVGVEFEWPIGNRGPHAAIRESRLRHFQAVAAVKQLIEQVAFEVSLAIRAVTNSQEQLGPQSLAIVSAQDALEALQAREERKDPATLATELGLQDDVANSRLAFLQALVDYNRAIVALEVSKGVLLEYYNVNLIEGPPPDEELLSGP